VVGDRHAREQRRQLAIAGQKLDGLADQAVRHRIARRGEADRRQPVDPGPLAAGDGRPQLGQRTQQRPLPLQQLDRRALRLRCGLEFTSASQQRAAALASSSEPKPS
jgi:hypothetical protein